MAADLSFFTLEDGAQSPSCVASHLVAFLDGAKQSLEIAIYDCALRDEAAVTVAASLNAAVDRGVRLRIGYYAGPHASPIVPPPVGSSESFLAGVRAPVRPIAGYQALMHHKYVVRDAGSPDAAVWTGSANWTNDSWSREENIVLVVPSTDLALRYRADFEELWAKGKIDNSGRVEGGELSLQFDGAEVATSVWFSPGGGRAMAHDVALRIGHATTRIVICSPVVTVGSILGALGDAIVTGRVPVRGIVDATQMAQVREQWSSNPQASWKIGAFDTLMRSAGLAGKRSTPYAPGSVHDFMHAKAIVIDNTVYAGSYNFSHSGEENAENLLRLESAALADALVAYVDRLIARYGAARA